MKLAMVAVVQLIALLTGRIALVEASARQDLPALDSLKHLLLASFSVLGSSTCLAMLKSPLIKLASPTPTRWSAAAR